MRKDDVFCTRIIIINITFFENLSTNYEYFVLIIIYKILFKSFFNSTYLLINTMLPS